MRGMPIMAVGLLLWGYLCFGGEGGETLFKSLGCMSCHHPEGTSKINPSLMDIASAYEDKPRQLAAYLNGQGAAMVKPEKTDMMKRYVEKTKALTDPERTAIAEFILAHKR